MILGYKELLSPQLYDSFKNTGSVHILAVSGLHLGIISSLLYFLLGCIRVKSFGITLVKTIIMLGSIWTYAILTGLAPSVIRASTIFSLFFLSKILNKDSNIYNLLALSAFVMLCLDPFLIWHLGFQFSYLAVLSILIFHSLLSSISPFDNKLATIVWNAIFISISAQIIITPFSIFYFHQFPSYFFLSSLIAVPGTAIIITLGLAILALHPIFPMMAFKVAVLDEFIMSWLVWAINRIDQLPLSVIHNIYFDKWMLFSLLASIIGIIGMIHYRKPRWITYSTLCIAIFILCCVPRHNQKNQDYKVFIYHHRRCLIVDFMINRTLYTYSDLRCPEVQEEYVSKNNRIHHRVNRRIRVPANKNFRSAHLRKVGQLIEFGNKIFYFPSMLNQIALERSDFVIISDSIAANSLTLLKSSAAAMIVHPNAPYKIKKSLSDNWSYSIEREGYFFTSY